MSAFMSHVCNKYRCGEKSHYAVIYQSNDDFLLQFGHIKKTAWGTNSNIYCKGRLSIHAEEVAIKKAMANKNFKWTKVYNIFVFRTTKYGKIGNSRPCANCILLLNKCKFNIRYVYYTTSNGSIAREKLDDMYDSPLTHPSSGDIAIIKPKH